MMNKIIATLVAATFAVFTTGSFAASSTGGTEMKDDTKPPKTAKKSKNKKSRGSTVS